jgi:hypothetical protein
MLELIVIHTYHGETYVLKGVSLSFAQYFPICVMLSG